MFSSSLRSSLIALAVAATAVSAAPGLSLDVTGPAAVDGVENLKVVTTITNTGDETLKLLNDPRNTLHSFPTNTFAVTTDDGASPSFTGVKVKYSLSNAAKVTDPSAFTILAPGQSVSLTHDRKDIYFLYTCRRYATEKLVRRSSVRGSHERRSSDHKEHLRPIQFRRFDSAFGGLDMQQNPHGSGDE